MSWSEQYGQPKRENSWARRRIVMLSWYPSWIGVGTFSAATPSSCPTGHISNHETDKGTDMVDLAQHLLQGMPIT